MTLLIAGHETTAAVLTWTFYILAGRADVVARIREEVDAVRAPGWPGASGVAGRRLGGGSWRLLLLLFLTPSVSPSPPPPPKLKNKQVLGDRPPSVADMPALRYTTRVINESMRLYPQPPVLIRRALEDDVFDGYPVEKVGARSRAHFLGFRGVSGVLGVGLRWGFYVN